MQRFIELLVTSCPDLHITDLITHDEVSFISKTKIKFSPDTLNKSLGTDFAPDEIQELLRLVDIPTVLHGDSITADIPLSRQDITIENDLYEEVARLIGYDRMPVTMPTAAIPFHPANHKLRLRERIRDAMVLAGLNEIISYSMSTPEAESKLWYEQGERPNQQQYVRLKNAVSSDKTVMRTTLIPGLLNIISYNMKYADACQLFEIGNVFIPNTEDPERKLPTEPLFLSIGIAGQEYPENFHDKKLRKLDFFDLKAYVEFLFEHLKIRNVSIENYEETHRLFQQGLCGVIKQGDQVYGYLGKVHPNVTSNFNLAGQSIFCAEISLEKVIDDAVRFFKFDDLEKFPSIKIDISLLVASDLTASQLILSIRELNNERIKNIEIVDLYSGSGIAASKKSISLRLTLYDSAKTLSQAEANTIRDEIVEFLKNKYHAVLR